MENEDEMYSKDIEALEDALFSVIVQYCNTLITYYVHSYPCI